MDSFLSDILTGICRVDVAYSLFTLLLIHLSIMLDHIVGRFKSKHKIDNCSILS